MHRLISVLGILVFLGLAWLMSSHKRRVKPRIIVGGLLLQFAFAAIILQTKYGSQFFNALDIAFTTLLACVNAGSEFVFGPGFTEHFFAFKVLPTIIFFSAFMSIFYYYGVMQFVVSLFARLMQVTLGTSGAETLSAAANIFVGQTEAPLVIRPYIPTMTISELNAIMIGGFATMAGGVLAAYVEMGISAKHLLSASVMAAPVGLMIAKILQPEVDEPKTLGHVKIDVKDPSANVLEAVANGAVGGLQLALNVGAMLIVFLALIALINLILGWLGAQFGYVTGEGENIQYVWSLNAALGWIFQPFAWLMGIEWNDCARAGELLGLKMAANEFIAYGQLAEWSKPDSAVEISERSRQIMTYALCGFANFSSIGIQLGGIGGMAPERRGDLARLGLRAMLGGTLVAFINACVANIMLS
ncbi:MAG: NupC/NupG family nucleoside CNT transporter [Planctomycetes bacterium]|nr:NupC/NupG family nucleoside CNT transporter [Planctomycetota bacterium]